MTDTTDDDDFPTDDVSTVKVPSEAIERNDASVTRLYLVAAVIGQLVESEVVAVASIVGKTLPTFPV